MRRGKTGRRTEDLIEGEAAGAVRDAGGNTVAGNSAARRFFDPSSEHLDLGTVATLLDEPPRARRRRGARVGSDRAAGYPASSHAPADQHSGQEGEGAPAPSSGRRRRRRALLLTFLTLLALLLGLNGAVALRDALMVGGTVTRLVPSGTQGVLGLLADDVRVLRFAVLRRAANAIKGPVRIGLQVGHLGTADQPDELAALRTSTGAHWDGVDEVTVNLAVVEALEERLTAQGFEVDVLNATVPVGYRADVLISVHADANLDTVRRGYKSAHTRPARNALEPLLKLSIDRSIFLATDLPDDDRNVSGNMLQYYAFNHRRFSHSAAPRTPALLVELGYLSNLQDMELLREPGLFADAIARGIVAFLKETGRL